MVKSRATCTTDGKAQKLRNKGDALLLVELRGCSPLRACTKDRAINSELYCEQLGRLYTVFKNKYNAFVNRNRVLFQQDNARPYTSRRTLQKLEEFDGVSCYQIWLTTRTWHHPIFTFSGQWHTFSRKDL